ncbi:MAG TPA: nitroreductase family protein [Thermoanaerobaculia bacterium]|nr:nitroreductase family protein [Thermoanaerobaculia bacterium]
MSSVERILESDPLIHELLDRRRSPRAFDPGRRVSRLSILTLLQAARVAPSCFNEQPWRFLVFDSDEPEALDQARSCLSAGNAWALRAPVLILSAAAQRWSRDGSPNRWAEHDVGLASENLALQATSLGFAAHFMGGFDESRARALFGIPEDFTPMAMIAVGYPADPDDLPPKLRDRELAPRRRKAIEEIVFSSRWDRPMAHWHSMLL